MSFSSDTKNELSRTTPQKKAEQLAEIAGFLRVSGSIRLAGSGRFRLIIKTDNSAVARHYKKLIQDYFSIETGLEVESGGTLRKGYVYALSVGPEMRSESILRETGILLVREGNNYISDGIYPGILRTKGCRKAYLRGLFMGIGTVSSPDKGYQLEFVCNTEVLANDLRKLIHTFDDLSVKITERKGKFVVYMRKAEYISDTLAIMGAHSQVLKYEDVRMRKELMNRTMRITNCDTANMDRTLEASYRQMEAIRRLKSAGRFGRLPAKVQELAEMRLEHPEASLAQLGEMMNPPLKKSGVNGRMKKIMDAAKDLVD